MNCLRYALNDYRSSLCLPWAPWISFSRQLYCMYYDDITDPDSHEGWHYTVPLPWPSIWYTASSIHPLPVQSPLILPSTLFLPPFITGNGINDWDKQSSAHLLRVRGLRSSYIRCAAMHGRSRVLPARTASALGGVPEQILQGGRVQVPALRVQSHSRESDTWVTYSYRFTSLHSHASIHAYARAYTPKNIQIVFSTSRSVVATSLPFNLSFLLFLLFSLTPWVKIHHFCFCSCLNDSCPLHRA